MPDTDLGALLLGLARAAIAHQLGLGPRPVPPPDPRLDERGATFVTLTLDGDLRGCIGSLRRTRKLGEDVITNAIAAASTDPRFAPLSRSEFDRVAVEVSLLSEPEFIDFDTEASLLRQIRPQTDGLILFAGCRSATFLPQVWAQLPEPADFLDALKRKAGLPVERPVDGLMAARYSVRKWHEPEPEPL
ncbi:MAG TPA: AmmeMemoRadiSam system protein A [Thauera sp.]|jgi:AmmeMemoRadiSam system protein A|nr:AmmeMemoRadiSam system protein A [Thauera sp.]